MALVEIDRKLSTEVTMRFKGADPFRSKDKVRFQFPPRIVSDGRKAEWAEVALRGDEYTAIYIVSDIRETRIEWTYIVGETSETGKVWTTGDVRSQVVGMRNYFSKVPHAGKGEELIIFFKMWHHGDNEEFTFRMKNVDITHGKTIVTPNGNVNEAYPLRTNIAADIRPWTEGGVSGGDDADAKIDLEKLPKSLRVGWV